MTTTEVRSDCQIDWYGNQFQLLSERGIYWPERGILLVADTHFGKEASFRAGAIPVPSGPTVSTVEAIGRMLDTTGAEEVLVLGDVFHARSSFADSILNALDTFFESRKGIRFRATLGNHDQRLSRSQLNTFVARWQFEVADTLAIGNLRFQHHPIDRADAKKSDAQPVISGHLHPAVSVGDRMDRLGKLPCFWGYGRQLVLPAIGYFTGSHRIDLEQTDRAWVIADNEVVAYH